jgi:hypothetical protein
METTATHQVAEIRESRPKEHDRFDIGNSLEKITGDMSNTQRDPEMTEDYSAATHTKPDNSMKCEFYVYQLILT